MTHDAVKHNTPPLATDAPLRVAPGSATERLEHSRERMRRYMLRAAAGDPQRQRAARSKRQVWLGVALAVALLLAWQQPWRRASGLARAAAFVIAGLKVPGLLSTLASRMEVLMPWWHTFVRAPAAQTDPVEHPQATQATQKDEQTAWDSLQPQGQARASDSYQPGAAPASGPA